jgi:hypothetical protein
MYDCVEDDYDPKCLVNLLWFMANMCIKEHEHLFCREAASVKHRATSFAAKMEEAGTHCIKILPNNHYGKNYMDKWVKQLCDLTGVTPNLKEKMGIMEPVDTVLICLLKPSPPLVETTMDSRHKGLGVHKIYMQGCQYTRDHKYEAQMLDPSCVVKYVFPRTSKNPKALLGVPDEIVPRKGTIVEYKTRGIFNLHVTPTPLIHEPLAEHAIGKTQEKQRCLPYKQPWKHLAITNQQCVCLHTEHIILRRPLITVRLCVTLSMGVD